MQKRKWSKTVKKEIKASVLGGSGYSGIELLKILSGHPSVQIDRVFANNSAGKYLHEINPWFKNRLEIRLESFSADSVGSSDVVFIALPSGEAMNVVPQLLRLGKKVIDFGGDFRLKDISLYEKFYKRTHSARESVRGAVYGLPEWNSAAIKSASLVANPGCYPTSAILPLAPLLKEGLVNKKGITVSSLSGVSGAGRSASVEMSFVEVNETVKAYKVGSHQHNPEIKTVLEDIVGSSVSITFVPHLIPITRGIYSSMYATISNGATTADIMRSYQKYYSTAPFVRVSENTIPEIKNVLYSNYIDIGFQLYPENNQIMVFSVIDNLVKGAAGQAVQNMNILFGKNETEGLL
jgi:N-acetyl-gamma-glutamyl-phosphate reductase